MDTLIDASKEVGLEANTEKTRYMLLSRYQNAGQNHDIKIAIICFENVSKVRYLGTTITNQILIQEEIKRRLNSGNACYHSVQNLLSSRLLSKNILTYTPQLSGHRKNSWDVDARLHESSIITTQIKIIFSYLWFKFQHKFRASCI
jgi:hypothetical protein